MFKIKSLIIASLLAMPAMTFAQVEADNDNDDEFDVTIDQKTTDTSRKISNRNATSVNKTTTNTQDIVTPVIEEVEEVDFSDARKTAVTTVGSVSAAHSDSVVTTSDADDFDNATVPTKIVKPEEIETVQQTTVAPIVSSSTAPVAWNGPVDDIDDVTIPENMFALDSLLTLYTNQTYLKIDEECNFPDYNPQYDDQEYINRLSKLPTVMELPYNSVVRQMIDRYTTRNRRGVAAMLATQNLYMPIFEEALEAYGLPLELKYLPVIESGLNPTVTSRAGASGLWQFMPGTAKKYGLEINSLVDERCDPIKSSYAAAKMLYDVYKVFGDWNLVIAAYNCGPGNVQKAIHRAGGAYDYWKIYPYLPKETRGYVPAFIAANYIMNYYCEHNICPMISRLPDQTDTVRVTSDIRFETIAKVLNISVKQIQELNPQYRHGIINGHSTKDSNGAILRLPTQQIIAFVDNEDAIYGGSAPYKRTTVTPGYTDTDMAYVPVTTSTDAPAARKETTETTSSRSTSSASQSSRHSSSASSSSTSSASSSSSSHSSHRSSSTSKSETSSSSSSSQSSHRSSSASKESKRESSSSRESSKSSSSRTSKSDNDRHSSKSDNSKNSKSKSSSKDSKSSSKDSKSSSKDSKSSKNSSKKQSGTSTHTVKEGETLSHIAARNGTTVSELRKKNPQIKGDKLGIGDKVRVK